jgi:outer membrane protein OmpA-like peptidoglycan-associated protein
MLGGLVPVCTLPIVAGLIPQNRYNDVNELLGSMSMQGKGIRMTRTMSLQSAGFLALIFLSAATPVLADDCTYLSAFRQAIQNKDIQAAKGLEAKIAVDAVCGPLTNRVRLQRVLLETATAETLLERPGREAEREALLTSAAEPGLFWGASLAIGDLRFSQRRFVDATRAYEQAIDIANNRALTPTPAEASIVKRMYSRAAQARLLAANEESSGASYVQVAKGDRGEVAGMYSINTRGPTPESIPVPINFETASAKMTASGEQAAEELAAAIKAQQPTEVTIVGHADERGSDSYNMGLSEKRARAVKDYLTSHGVNAVIKVVAKGKRDALQIEDSSGMSKEDIWALNRRVEWRRSSGQE